MSKDKHTKALDKTKIGLMRIPNNVFFTTILFSLKQVWKEDIPTAAVDGIHLFINPTWFLGLTPKARIGLLAHEVLHLALNHITRQGDRTHSIWNGAGDYIINNTLVSNGYELPPDGLVDVKYRQYNTEQLYKVLYAKAKDEAAQSGGSIDMAIPGIGSDIQSPATNESVPEIEQKIAEIILHATMQAEAAGDNPGNLPAEIQIELQKLINPKLPWYTILNNYLTSFAMDDYTMQRPNRRFLPDFYLPSAHSEAICNLTVAVDSSGSVDDNEFSYFINEIVSIQETMQPEKIMCIDFDTSIKAIHEITQSTDILKDLTFTGRGGTDVTELLNWAVENNPDVLLVFTDGGFHMPDIKPDCPVVWLIHSNPSFTAPFGEIIHYEIGK